MEEQAARYVGNGHVEGVELKDGRVLAAGTVVVAVDIKPNEVAAHAGIAVNRGIVVDDHPFTSTSDVFAIGECAEHRGVCYGLVEPSNEQARVLATRFSDRDARNYPQRTTHARNAEHDADVSGLTRHQAKWL